MITVVCVDSNGGISFNGRRQSQDKAVIADVVQLALERGVDIAMSDYSKPLFEKYFAEAKEGTPLPKIVPDKDAGIFFSELGALPDIDDPSVIEGVIEYCWNRTYPADNWYTGKQVNGERKLVAEKEFQGNSHEKITRKDYV